MTFLFVRKQVGAILLRAVVIKRPTNIFFGVTRIAI